MSKELWKTYYLRTPQHRWQCKACLELLPERRLGEHLRRMHKKIYRALIAELQKQSPLSRTLHSFKQS